jgi:hypothetical protein
MKIAYINEFPQGEDLEAFMQEYRMENGQSSLAGVDKEASEPGYVIAAYDNNRLVAFGFAPADETAPQMDSAAVFVLPAYGNRGIGTNVFKLLLAEWKFSPVTAVH